MAAPLLLLFDIDGTLLRRASREHAQALYEALDAVFGIGTAQERGTVQYAGRTDLEIARGILTARGIPKRRVDEGLPAVRVAACEAYGRLVPDDLSGQVPDGLRDVLEWLGGRDDVVLSLLTGNLEPIARLKLRAAGIGHFFPAGQGGFGSDSEDRSDLPAIARERAGGADGAHPRERTIVIGDTPRDIACARADDVRVVGVTTGPFGPDELATADAVATSAAELRAAIEPHLG